MYRAHMEGQAMQRTWSPQEPRLPIEKLELRVIRLACEGFLPHIHNQSIQVLWDNMTVIYYIN